MSVYIEMIQFYAALSDEKFAAAMKFANYIYSPESIAKYGNLIKQPVPRKDNILPENFTMVHQMLEDVNV